MVLSLLSAAEDFPLPAQLGVLVPFLFALWFILRWLLNKIDTLQTNLDALTAKVIDKAIPALEASAAATKEMIEVAREQSRQINIERELRIRAEERNRS